MNSLLDAYGYDSDESEQPYVSEICESKANEQKNALPLLDYDSDADDMSSNRADKPRQRNEENKRDQISDTLTEKDRSPPFKKECQTYLLPIPPILSSSNFTPFQSLILFDHDFLTDEMQRYSDQSRTWSNFNIEKQKNVEMKLDQMFKKFYGEDTDTSTRSQQSFSHHLKQQKEFSNPATLQNIIQEFDIDPHGTNLPSQCWNPKVDFSPCDFYEQVSKREEENRIRESNPS